MAQVATPRPICKVVDNNIDGMQWYPPSKWLIVAQTEPNVTLDVGTELVRAFDAQMVVLKLDDLRAKFVALKTKLDERTAWLRKEWQRGGNFEHLSAREDECGYIASLVGTLLSSDGSAKR